jgi:hypothetical protein
MAHNYFYMPRLGYGKPVTALTKQYCKEIQKPVVNAILPKMGIVWSALRAVVFGTSQFVGLGLAHLK